MISCNQIIQCALSTHVLIYSQSLKLSKRLYSVYQGHGFPVLLQFYRTRHQDDYSVRRFSRK